MRRAAAWAIVSIAAILAMLVIASCPAWRGFHTGCDPWEGRQREVVWAGVQFCRLDTEREAEVARVEEP
jgi:hypothetical protein